MTLSENPNHASFAEPLAETISLEELIRQRAHEIWVSRGCQLGSEVQDWLDAEEELLRG